MPRTAAEPLMDYSTLSAKDTGEPLTRAGGGYAFKALEGTPIEADLTASHQSGTSRQYTVKTEDQAKQVRNLLTMAARKTGIGVRVKVEPKGRQFTVTFQGKDRAQHDPATRLPRQHKNESDADFKSRTDAWETSTGQNYAERRAALDARKSA